MRNYKYKAVNSKGKIISDTTFAENPYILFRDLNKSGLKLINYATVRNIKYRIFKINYKTLSMLTSQLSELLESAVPLDKALYIIAKNSKDKILSDILIEVHKQIKSGESLSNSFSIYREFFPQIFINLISFGEKTCLLSKVLSELSISFDKKYKNLQSVKTKLMYPICVLILSVSVFAYLLLAVIPKFSSVLSQLSGETPGGIGFLMRISDFVSDNKLIILALIFSPVLFIIYFKRNIFKSEELIQRFLKIRFIKNIYDKFFTKSFLQDLNTVISAGVKIQTGIEIIRDCSKNSFVKEKLNKCIYKLQSGEKFTKSLEEIDFLLRDTIALLKISETSGDIEGVVSKMISFSQNELDEYLKRLLTMIEPIIILLLSFLVGAIVISVFLPMLSIMDKII